ncbi:MAG: glycoside hydrolase [Chitinophagaceae bacterium]|nr:glycoside hydrolase [Chitinophagaceae bacterium]
MKLFFSFTVLAAWTFLATSCDHSSEEALKHVKDAQHAIIYYQPGKFAGWPANCGAFIFNNDEIVTGFIEANYKITNSHNAAKPYLNWLARSTDGGKTWTAADPDNYAGDFGERPDVKMIDTPINYKQPGFAMRVVGEAYHGATDGRGHFFYSYDAGKTWNGPYGFGDVLGWPEITAAGFDELTPRTDYIVNDSSSCLLFVSARKKNKFSTDRLFCIETTDGGKTYHFQGWVVGPAGTETSGSQVKVNLFEDADKNPYANECRAVMSQSQKLDDGTIISMIRRKYIVNGEGTDKHWIDAYTSTDGGKTWSFLSKVADTGNENGNPPSFALTKDGRLCVVYGERNEGTIRVVYSADKGKTWSEPQILMDGFWSEDMQLNDLGYPRVVCRSDGKMVAMYYYSTKENPHHLRATIWEP